MREALDPAHGSTFMLPPDDRLIGDLTGPKWRIESSGAIRVEDKSETKKRLGRSPDAADAVLYMRWNEPNFEEAPAVEYFPPLDSIGQQSVVRP